MVVAGLGLLDITDFKAIYRYRRAEFWVAVFTAVAVLVVGMLAGILIAVGLSLLMVVLRAAEPSTAILGRMPGTDTYRDIEDHEGTETYPGLLIYRFDAPLFFANAGRLRDDITAAVEDAEPSVRMVLIDAEAISDIDSTGAQVLLELLDALEGQDIELALARVRTELMDELKDRASRNASTRTTSIWRWTTAWPHSRLALPRRLTRTTRGTALLSTSRIRRPREAWKG